MRFGRALVFVAAGALSSCAFGQGIFGSPHVLTDSAGNVLGVAWDVSGGQRTVGTPVDPPGFTPFQGLFSLHGNDSIYQWICRNVNGTPTSATYDIYSAAKDEPLGWTLGDMIPLKIVLPGWDMDARAQSGVRVVGRITFKAKEGASRLASGSMPRRQAIIESPVASRVGDLPTANAVKVDEITLLRAVDAEGPYYRVSDIGIEVPISDAPAFQRAFEASLAGAPTEYPVQIDYLDGDGLPLLRFNTVCRIVGAGPGNPWLEPTNPKATFKAILRSINDGRKSILNVIR